MKSDRSILIAFILNLAFSIIEFVGGCMTNSIAITSDAIHDMGDALSLGIAYILERLSKKKPDEKYTYGYTRYSVFGSLITTSILLTGSCFVVYKAMSRVYDRVDVDTQGVIMFALLGIIVNIGAFYITHGDRSLNQKAVRLHMLEDLLGWVVILIIAIITRHTPYDDIDAIMAMVIAMFMVVSAIQNLRVTIELLMDRVPRHIDIDKIKQVLLEIDGVVDIHHIHLWSTDGNTNYITLHAVTDKDSAETKDNIRHILNEYDIEHITIEIESTKEQCNSQVCSVEHKHKHGHGCNHH